MVLFIDTFVKMYTNHVMGNIQVLKKENTALKAQNRALKMAYCEFYPDMSLALHELKEKSNDSN